MILRLAQKKREPRLLEVSTLDGTVICRAETTGKFCACVDFGQELNFIKAQSTTEVGIFDGTNTQIGSIQQVFVEQKKMFGLIPTGYDYFEVTYKGKHCSVYHIGLGPDKNFLCFCQDGKTLAITNKDDLVKDYLNTYTLYIMDSSDMEMVIAVTMFFDSGAFYISGARMGNRTERIPFFTKNEALNKKYNPTFIPRIWEMEKLRLNARIY